MILDSMNNAILVDILSNTLPYMILQQIEERNVSSDTPKNLIFELLRDCLIQADNIVGAVTNLTVSLSGLFDLRLKIVQP